MAASAEPYQTVRFAAKDKLTNRHSVDKILKRVPEKQINKLMLAFDEVPLTYTCPESADSDQFKPMAPVALNSENFSTFIGVTKYIDPGMRNAAGGLNGDIDGAESDGESVMGAESFESNTDEIDERRHLKAYWRAEEGHGPQIADVSDKGINLQVKDGELSWH